VTKITKELILMAIKYEDHSIITKIQIVLEVKQEIKQKNLFNQLDMFFYFST